MGNFKGKESFTLQLVIIILVNLDLIKNKVEEFIIGLVKKVTFMKVSLKLENVMVEALSGGVTEAGMKENSKMEFKVDGVFFIDKEEIDNMKEIGITVCLMEKVLNISKTVSVIKEHSKKINSTDKVSSIKMTQLFMVFGKIMNFQLSIWLNQV